jgi:hypothetical protein
MNLGEGAQRKRRRMPVASGTGTTRVQPIHRRLGSLTGFSLYAGVVVHADQGTKR